MNGYIAVWHWQLMMVSLTLPVVAKWEVATLVNSFFSTATIVDCDRSLQYIKGRLLDQMFLKVMHNTFSHAMSASSYDVSNYV